MSDRFAVRQLDELPARRRSCGTDLTVLLVSLPAANDADEYVDA